MAALFVAVVAVVALNGGGESSAGSGEPRQGSGPNVSGLAIERFDGSIGTLADYGGKPLLLNFWASWCVPCLREMPGFEAVSQNRGDQITFLGVNLQDQDSDAAAVINQTGVTYELARDRDGSLFTRLGGVGMPTTVFIDSEGNVIETISGEISADDLDDKIKDVVGA